MYLPLLLKKCKSITFFQNILLTLLEFKTVYIHVYITNCSQKDRQNLIYVNKVFGAASIVFFQQKKTSVKCMEQETDWVPVPLQNMYQGVLLQSTQSDPQGNLSGMRDPSFARSSPPSDHHSQQS